MNRFLLIGLSMIGLLMLFTLPAFLNKTDFIETLNLTREEIIEVKMNTPANFRYKTTTDTAKINILLEYLSKFEYKRLSGDVTSYMPKRASIIYLSDKEQVSFIVPYKKEVMINHKVYKIKNGSIEMDFIIRFYESL